VNHRRFVKAQYTLFYDGSCGMCSKAVRFVLQRDKHKRFLITTLEGKTAEKELAQWRTQHPEVDSIVLLSPHHQIFFYSQATFRILWALGFPWLLVGWLSFLPHWLLFPCDVVYRFVAKRRKKWCPLHGNEIPPNFHNKFLP